MDTTLFTWGEIVKRRSYYILIVGLLIVGILTVNFYQRKQEERMLAFEGYEISTIADRVNALYNEEKTDIADDLTDEEFEDLEIILEDLSTKDLTNSSEKDIQSMHVEFLEARDMYTIQNDIENLFEQKIIIRTVNLDKVSKLENKLEAYTTRTIYYDRNKKLVEEANEQITAIKEARDFVESLHDDEGNFLEGVTQEDIAKALEIIENIKNKEIRNDLAASLDGEIIESEEEDDEEEIEEVEEVDDTPVEEQESTPTRPTRPNPAPSPTPPAEDMDEGETIDPDRDETPPDQDEETPPSDNGSEDSEEDNETQPEPTPAPDPETDTEPGLDPENPDNNDNN